jgi:hypothetical protein
MARSPARSSAPLPLSGEGRWHDKEKEQHHHHHQYYTMNIPRNQEQSSLLGQYGKNATSAGGATATPSENVHGKTDDNSPASRGMVIFSVLFYLVAALVMVSSMPCPRYSRAHTCFTLGHGK